MEGFLYTPKGKSELGNLYQITEFAGGGDLRAVIGKINKDPHLSPENKVLLMRHLMTQVIDGMHYVQSERQMIHFDLKPENVFITSEGQVKVADLGSAVLTVKTLLGDPEELPERSVLVDAPFVEGAVSAAVTASAGADLDTVVAAAREAYDYRKV